MPVFISHRTADDAIAKEVYQRLRFEHNIVCYLDDIDQELERARHTERITELLVKRLRCCTNLLAIVSQNTRGSWWVPFEIGVARQAPRVITSFTNQVDRDLPEYLLEWPRLRGAQAVDVYANLYKRQRQVLTEQVLEGRGAFDAQTRMVEGFHRDLKGLLNQA
jgi:hypothetical protein